MPTCSMRGRKGVARSLSVHLVSGIAASLIHGIHTFPAICLCMTAGVLAAASVARVAFSFTRDQSHPKLCDQCGTGPCFS